MRSYVNKNNWIRLAYCLVYSRVPIDSILKKRGPNVDLKILSQKSYHIAVKQRIGRISQIHLESSVELCIPHSNSCNDELESGKFFMYIALDFDMLSAITKLDHLTDKRNPESPHWLCFLSQKIPSSPLGYLYFIQSRSLNGDLVDIACPFSC